MMSVYDVKWDRWTVRLDAKIDKQQWGVDLRSNVDPKDGNRALLQLPAGIAGVTANVSRYDLADALENLAKIVRGQTN